MTAKENVFNLVPDVIEAIRRGELVIVTDDENRENEGDLVGAAECITPSHINFMARYGRGLVCVALDKQRLRKLGVEHMPKRGQRDHYNTAFMESVDAIEGISTGISAFDRAHTIQLLLAEDSTRNDFVSPGHVFPLAAADGGVLERAGHTEAAVDLASMAGFKRAGVICEIIRDDGEMARLPDLIEFAKEHKLLITSVADLVHWRNTHDLLTLPVR